MQFEFEKFFRKYKSDERWNDYLCAIVCKTEESKYFDDDDYSKEFDKNDANC